MPFSLVHILRENYKTVSEVKGLTNKTSLPASKSPRIQMFHLSLFKQGGLLSFINASTDLFPCYTLTCMHVLLQKLSSDV